MSEEGSAAWVGYITRATPYPKALGGGEGEMRDDLARLMLPRVQHIGQGELAWSNAAISLFGPGDRTEIEPANGGWFRRARSVFFFV